MSDKNKSAATDSPSTSVEDPFWADVKLPQEKGFVCGFSQNGGICEPKEQCKTLAAVRCSVEVGNKFYYNRYKFPSEDTSKGIPKNIRKSFKKQRSFCILCFKNKKNLYFTHILKAKNGKIICPMLRSVVCRICSATGDYAHTLTYCPYYKKK